MDIQAFFRNSGLGKLAFGAAVAAALVGIPRYSP